MTLHYHCTVFIILLCVSKIYSTEFSCPGLNGFASSKLRVKLAVSVNPTYESYIVGTCECVKYQRVTNVTYFLEAYIGNRSIGRCTSTNPETNPNCSIKYKLQSADSGTPWCYAVMTRTDDEKIITRCSAPMDFEIAIGGFIKKSCSFYGGKMLNFGIKMNGTSASYQIFQSEHIKVSRVDWLLGNKPIKNCDLNQSKSDGNDNRCELNVAEYAGKLECRITGVVAMATLSRYYAGYCVASIELEGSTKNEAAKTVASTKNLLSGPQNQKILTLKTNGTDQIVGRLRWGGPEDAVRNITGGEMFKKWCKIEDLLPRGTYSYRWVLKPLDNGKVPDKPLFDKCNQTKVDANNTRYVFCGSTYADLPMYDEGDIVCRATYIDTLLNDPATVDSDVIYRVKSHPHIQLNLTTSNGGSYLSATCSVSKFEGYSLNWTSVGEQLNNTDIESCGNETHSCTQLRKQFTSNTTVYCQYWSSKFIERKEIAIKINLSGPITTFPTTRPFINERAITSTAAQPTTKEPIPTTTEIPEPIISSTSNSTTKKAELPTETAIPSTTENTTSLSTPTPSPGADTRAAGSGQILKKYLTTKATTKITQLTTIPSTKISSKTTASTKITRISSPTKYIPSIPIGDSARANNTLNFGTDANLTQTSTENTNVTMNNVTIQSTKNPSTTIPSNNVSSCSIGDSTSANNTLNFGTDAILIQVSTENTNLPMNNVKTLSTKIPTSTTPSNKIPSPTIHSNNMSPSPTRDSSGANDTLSFVTETDLTQTSTENTIATMKNVTTSSTKILSSTIKSNNLTSARIVYLNSANETLNFGKKLNNTQSSTKNTNLSMKNITVPSTKMSPISTPSIKITSNNLLSTPIVYSTSADDTSNFGTKGNLTHTSTENTNVPINNATIPSTKIPLTTTPSSKIPSTTIQSINMSSTSMVDSTSAKHTLNFVAEANHTQRSTDNRNVPMRNATIPSTKCPSTTTPSTKIPSTTILSMNMSSTSVADSINPKYTLNLVAEENHTQRSTENTNVPIKNATIPSIKIPSMELSTNMTSSTFSFNNLSSTPILETTSSNDTLNFGIEANIAQTSTENTNVNIRNISVSSTKIPSTTILSNSMSSISLGDSTSANNSSNFGTEANIAQTSTENTNVNIRNVSVSLTKISSTTTPSTKIPSTTILSNSMSSISIGDSTSANNSSNFGTEENIAQTSTENTNVNIRNISVSPTKISSTTTLSTKIPSTTILSNSMSSISIGDSTSANNSSNFEADANHTQTSTENTTVPIKNSMRPCEASTANIPTTLPSTSKNTITTSTVASTTMLSTTKTAQLSTPNTVPSTTEKTTSPSTSTVSIDTNTRDEDYGRNNKFKKSTKQIYKTTRYSTVPSTKISSMTTTSTKIPSTTIPSNNMSSKTTGNSTSPNNTLNCGTEANLTRRSNENRNELMKNTMRPFEESDIAIIVGILITIFGNVLVCAVAVCYARRRGCLHRGPEEQSQRQISNTRPGASKANPEEPAYSIPHKWLSRPSKKEPAVTYTSLDLMPSASWAGRDDTPYAEIVGVEQPEYAEVHQQPVYSNLMDSEPGCSNVVKYANSNASVANPEAQYAFVLPKSMRKK